MFIVFPCSLLSMFIVFPCSFSALHFDSCCQTFKSPTPSSSWPWSLLCLSVWLSYWCVTMGERSSVYINSDVRVIQVLPLFFIIATEMKMKIQLLLWSFVVWDLYCFLVRKTEKLCERGVGVGVGVGGKLNWFVCCSGYSIFTDRESIGTLGPACHYWLALT